MSGVSIGIMDPAYFVGRKALVEWINTTFQMNLTKIEETSTGCVACQILDAIYPGEIPMSKVRWDAKSPHEARDNYKLIQQLFEKKNITRMLDIEKLVRGKCQDNLEAMQWMKSFFDKNYSGAPYDPLARRAIGKGADSMPMFAVDPSRRGPAAPAPTARNTAVKGTAVTGAVKPKPNTTSPAKVDTGRIVAPAIQELKEELKEAHNSIESLEKERDFYFGKLRQIEIMLQSYTGPDQPTVDEIFKILYATDDDFVSVDQVQQ